MQLRPADDDALVGPVDHAHVGVGIRLCLRRPAPVALRVCDALRDPDVRPLRLLVVGEDRVDVPGPASASRSAAVSSAISDPKVTRVTMSASLSTGIRSRRSPGLRGGVISRFTAPGSALWNRS